MMEKTVAVFSDMPALKLGRYFTGIAAETTASIFRLNAANTAIFSVKRRWHLYFSGATPLRPLFFRFNAVNATIFPVQRC